MCWQVKSEIICSRMARLMSGLLLVLHLLLISQNEVMQVEGAVCSTKSKLFKGVCMSDRNCASICEKEGFLYGHCKGILMECLCYKDCKGAAPHKPPPPPPTPRTPPCDCPKPPLSPPPPTPRTHPPPPPCDCPKPPLSPPPPTPRTHPPPPPCGCPKPPATPPPPCGCHNPPPPPCRHPKIGPPCVHPTPPVK